MENKKTTVEERARKEPILFSVYIILRIFVVFVMIAQFANGHYKNVFLCLLTLLVFMMPSLIEKRLKIDIPNTLEVIILIFVFSAEILGEISAYYQRYTHWDTALHVITGFLAAAVGFSLVEVLNRNSKNISLSPFYLSFVAFCFSMTIAVMWEFLEFSLDMFFGMDTQKDFVIHTINTIALDKSMTNTVVSIKDIDSVVVNGVDLGLGGYLDIGLIDTMKDMAVSFVGAVVFSTFGYFYVKGNSKGKFAKRFIPTRMKEEEKL